MNKYLLTTISLLFCISLSFAQETDDKKDKGEFSGNFQNTNQFYVRDSTIGATTTQYQRQLSSSDAWLFLSYKYKGFKFNVRYDVFNNSPLFDPQQAFTQSGIGMWNISKDIDKFNVTVGYFYDQFGTGMVFRAFEDRNLGLDFAINGARVIWTPSTNTTIKAFTGLQKFRFDIRPEVIKGINAEHRIEFTENFNIEPGASIVNRTIDPNTMNSITGAINSYKLEDRFVPTYNVFLGNVYTTLNYKDFSWYVEYCQKSKEAFNNQKTGLMELRDGRVYYTSMSYSTKGLGINAQYKRIESFSFRTSPLENLNLGMIAYLPSLTRQNTYRLLARYNAVVQELGENALGLEFTIKPQAEFFKKHQTTININTSIVTGKDAFSLSRINPFDTQTDTARYFREHYIDISHKFNKKFKAMLGFQYINYNQQLFELKDNSYDYVTAKTYFGEMTYKLTPTKSVRVEAQYLQTKQDLGSFINGTVELNIAPHYSFSIGDMVNVDRVQRNTQASSTDLVHYWNVFSSYTYKTTRLTAGYIKQVEGVNCTGGVCRVEPAFSGVRVTLQTNF
ncbi:MAG: DUF6029 family protein [Bacteroidota bacterium]